MLIFLGRFTKGNDCVTVYNLSCKLKLRGGVIIRCCYREQTTLLWQLRYAASPPDGWLVFIFEAEKKKKHIKTVPHVLDFPGGFLNVNVSEVSFDEIHQRFSRDSDIEPGGHWRPKDCKPRWKVRRVVPGARLLRLRGV